MYDSKRAVAVMLAVLTVVGFAVAPTAAVAQDLGDLDGDQVTDQVTNVTNETDVTNVQADHGPVPHDICTDLQGMLHEQAPYDMIIWVDDLPEDVPQDVPQKEQLPEELRPPGVPWSVVTPSAIGGIVVGATPNQCDIQDPNDLSYDPIQDSEDNVAPDAGGDVQPGETGEVLFVVNGTLDETSDGPSGMAEADLKLTENGTLDPDTELNDGEKDYGVDPNLQYWSDGTTYFETDVYVFGRTLGVEQDCFGEECNFATRGLPNFVDYPAIPSHTDRKRPSGSDDGSEGTDGTEGTDDSADSEGGGGAGSGPSTVDTSDSGGGSGGGDSTDSSDGADRGTSDGDTDGSDGSANGEGPSTDGTDGNDRNGGNGQSTEADANQQQRTTENGGDQTAEQAGFGGAKGLGVLVALVVFILGAGAIVPRD